MKWWCVMLAVVAAAPSAVLGAQARDTSGLRVHLALGDEVRVGQAAPPVVLPYVTSAGPGPVSQPFDLAKELGHVVVLVFYQGNDAMTNWRAFAAHPGTRPASDLVFAGVSDGGVAAQAGFARQSALPYKFLADIGGRLARHYGMSGERFGVVVVGRDGRVVLVRPEFAPGDAASYRLLDQAIRTGREIR